MGKIYCSRISLISSLSEMVGYKSGLALGRSDMHNLVPEWGEVWEGKDDAVLRMGSDEISQTLALLLHRVGNIPSPNPPTPGRILYTKYGQNEELWQIVHMVVQILSDCISSRDQSSKQDE